MKAYLLTFYNFEPPLISRRVIQDHLESRSEVLNWLGFFPHAMVVVSDHSAEALTEIIHERFPTLQFLLTEIVSNSAGFLPKYDWDFINDPSLPKQRRASTNRIVSSMSNNRT